MKCPTLESWLSAIDSGTGRPEGAHLECDACSRNEAEANRFLECLRTGIPRSPVGDDVFVERVVSGTRRGGRLVVLAGPPLAAAAVVLLAIWLGRGAARPEDHGLVARGGGTGDGPACEVAEVTPAGLAYLRDGAEVPEGARVAFRVRNPSGEPRFLGVFAVTSAGQVGWFHPAWENAADDPRTRPLPASAEPQLLPDAVSLPLGRGPVRLVCWQSERPWSVREADAAIARALAGRDEPTAVDRIDALGGTQTSLTLTFGESD